MGDLAADWPRVVRAVRADPSDSYDHGDVVSLLEPLLDDIGRLVRNDDLGPGVTTVAFGPDFAGVAIAYGGGKVAMLADGTPGQGPRTTWVHDLTPVERAVNVARLRAWADALEVGPDAGAT